MAAALRAAEGGGYIFPNPQGGYIQNFSGQGGGIPLIPPIPDPWYRTHLFAYSFAKIYKIRFINRNENFKIRIRINEFQRPCAKKQVSDINQRQEGSSAFFCC